MINPAEEIVNIWLQDCHNLFIMNNRVVRKKTRLAASGRKIGGGRGKEIDFIATDGNGKYYWIEVAVSANPRLPGGAEKSRKVILDNAIGKFVEDKYEWIKDNFKIKSLQKWFVYSPNLFSFMSDKKNEEKRYREKLKKDRGIETFSFLEVLKQVYDNTKVMGYDSARQYIFLLKKMGFSYDK